MNPKDLYGIRSGNIGDKSAGPRKCRCSNGMARHRLRDNYMSLVFGIPQQYFSLIECTKTRLYKTNILEFWLRSKEPWR